ncbi:hypothetical protein [Sulfurivirga sp.]|uniref:hypothetical protein n=1 Tax=Sulfurivirga sp. TaxID=2614236 RepID=UPI0025D3E54F|nr:hypothetical protein [Sulfurivirga sp.]
MKKLTLSGLRRLERTGENVFITVEMGWEASEPVWEAYAHYLGRVMPVAFDDYSSVRSVSVPALCNLLSDCGTVQAVLNVEQVARAYRMGPESEEDAL